MKSLNCRKLVAFNESFNTELIVIKALSTAAMKTKRAHGVVLMVELGDLREGIMPGDLNAAVQETLNLPYIDLHGIGTNLACQNGVIPNARNMGELSTLADAIEDEFDIRLRIVSGGNSGNLPWALSEAPTARINNLRLGEAIALGCEPSHRQPIEGLHSDAIQLVTQVIEAKEKPSRPRGDIGETAFGEGPPVEDRGTISQAILAIGRQDIDPSGIHAPHGITILGASSDHLIVDSGRYPVRVGEEIAFSVNYSALVRAMTSPFVAKIFKTQQQYADPILTGWQSMKKDEPEWIESTR